MSLTINLIQDLATPHNNVLIREFSLQSEVNLVPWYAVEGDRTQYQWQEDITHEFLPARIYGKRLNLRFIWHCLSHPHERYVVVGWANANTRLLHLLFFLLRRPYNHWTDLPSEETRLLGVKKRLARWLAYKILRYSRAVVLGVGKTTLGYFRSIGFPARRVVNMPIFICTDENIGAHVQRGSQIIAPYGITESDYVISAGSRLVWDKGYDLLIAAIAHLGADVRQRTKALIVGSGVCNTELKAQVKDLGLEQQVVFIDWLAIEDFKALIACSDVFIHPARVDSYGGTTLGMALGVPVIGSTGAGAAVDRIEHGVNGFLYEAEDTQQLARYIEKLYRDPGLREKMAEAALATAKSWPPKRGMEIMINETI